MSSGPPLPLSKNFMLAVPLIKTNIFSSPPAGSPKTSFKSCCPVKSLGPFSVINLLNMSVTSLTLARVFDAHVDRTVDAHPVSNAIPLN
eukprot:CAMPEP_0115731032 /NCGR_PEP_ID=MMETSP0272-20121206/84357_1 /TAXON_ID=71861 /ORGANISM="Scrippsiella trochoidea, Strain CCMP3099" /LENGTH=88 /DNA_ID=CAMNT_0003174819 /DNA_START=52 /DNA_END=314 /DNA_ORIENTATION=-